MKASVYINDAWSIWPAVAISVDKDKWWLHIVVLKWELQLGFRRKRK